MVSVDCDVYAKMLVAREWEGVSQHLLKGIDRLVLAGCNMICIASNTGHIVYPAITSKYPDVSVLHIADATAAAIKVSTSTTTTTTTTTNNNNSKSTNQPTLPYRECAGEQLVGGRLMGRSCSLEQAALLPSLMLT